MPLDSSDRHQAEVAGALTAITDGARGRDVESETLDCKRDPASEHGGAQATRHDPTARLVADGLACLANAQGGALVLGVDDEHGGPRALLGTGLDEEWLAQRVFQLTGGPPGGIRARVIVHRHEGQRLLVLLCDASPHPVPNHLGAYRRRRGTDCEPIPPHELSTFALRRGADDPTSAPTDVDRSAARPAALQAVRDYLRSTGMDDRIRLAGQDDQALLVSLGLIVPETPRLNRAGQLLLTRLEDEEPLIDLIVRPAPGAPTTARIDRGDISLIEQLVEVERTLNASNPVVTVSRGFARGEVRHLPQDATREAIVNAIMHREWREGRPITVEKTGDTLVVTSPGGFVPEVTPHNVLTTPSITRNPQLAQAMRSLRLAEREGSGIDRMYHDMIVVGHEPPEIAEWASGTQVRCVLIGGPPVPEVMDLWASLPEEAADDVDVAVILHVLRDQPTITVSELAPRIQKTPREASAALTRARTVGLVQEANRQGRYRLSDDARDTLRPLLDYLRTTEERAAELISAHLEEHGDIRAADVIDLLDVSQSHASYILKREVDAGRIEIPEGAPTRGRGVHYVAAGERSPDEGASARQRPSSGPERTDR